MRDQVNTALSLWDTVPTEMIKHMGHIVADLNTKKCRWIDACLAEGLSDNAIEVADDIRIEGMHAMMALLNKVDEENSDD